MTIWMQLEREQASRQSSHADDTAYRNQATAIAVLLARVPLRMERERLLAETLAAGQAAGLRIEGGRYDETPSQGVLQRLEVTLPVTTDSIAALRWLEDLGERVPTAVPSRISLNRGAAGEPLVGEIRLDVYLRGTP
jgi:hypothetical protein